MTTKLQTKCIETTYAKDRFGYGMGTSPELYQRSVQHHRVVYAEANNTTLAAIKGRVVRHKCDNPSCVNPAHLEIGTAKDNMADMISRGRRVDHHGVANGNAKVTEEIVRQIRAERRLTLTEIGIKYKIATATARQIVNNLTWKHI